MRFDRAVRRHRLPEYAASLVNADKGRSLGVESQRLSWVGASRYPYNPASFSLALAPALSSRGRTLCPLLPAEVHEHSPEVAGVLLHPVVESLDLLLIQEAQYVLLECV